MSELQPLTQSQTIEIMAESAVMPEGIVARIAQSQPRSDRPDESTPALAVPEIFSRALDDLIEDKGPEGPHREIHASRQAAYRHIVALGSSSILMAHMLGADIAIPRRRVLHEHTQSALNIHTEYMATLYTDPRDRVLPAAHFLKDIGKSYAVAIHPERRNKDQAVHNNWVTARLLLDSNLTPEERIVTQLHVEEDVIGWALRHHTEKGKPLDVVLARARAVLDSLLERCPDAYRDRFMFQLAGVTFTDMAAHTQRAHFISAQDGEEYQDVTDSDRYFDGMPANGDAKRSLDRLFSEAPEDRAALRFHRAGHIAVIRGLFPDHYEQFVSEGIHD